MRGRKHIQAVLASDSAPPNLLETNPDLLAYIVEKIVCAVGPRQVIIFSSQARGIAGEASDLDLFVVNGGPLSNRQLRGVVQRLMAGPQFGIDMVVRRPEEVARNIIDGNPFYS